MCNADIEVDIVQIILEISEVKEMNRVARIILSRVFMRTMKEGLLISIFQET